LTRILLTAAGGGVSENLLVAIRASSLATDVVGMSCDRFSLARSSVERAYLVPRADAGLEYVRAVRRIVERERIQLIIPGHDAEVAPLSRYRNDLGARPFLPRHETIEQLQDKLKLNQGLSALGTPVARTHPYTDTEAVDRLLEEAGAGGLVWCRLRRSSASRGSLPVNSRAQLDAWIGYWEEMRGVGRDQFIVSQYLPGRDFAFQSLWDRGHLVLAKCCERLVYLAGDWMPSGTSSTPRVARLTNEAAVNQVCEAAVRGLDAEASGIYCIDLKEDRHGQPCITEVNVGRFFMISPVFNLVGRHNMAELFIRLALGETIEVDDRERFSDIGDRETYLVREFDGAPAILSKQRIDNMEEG
jgi:carbamoyl-phosphate synthase large subunit